MKSNLNLNEVNGTYSKLLSDNIQSIYSAYNDATVDTANFRNFIIGITEKANDTNAYRNFRMNLDKKRTKDDLVMYVSNVTLMAQHLGSNPDSKWSNER